MSDEKIRSQVFKTDEVFVGKKHEKKMYLLRKSELIFNKIANAIDFQNKLEDKQKIRKSKSKKRPDTRIAKRTYYYEFYLFDGNYDYKKIEKEMVPEELKLKKNDFKLDDNFKGIFKGSELSLIDFLDSLYE
jgi:hypothetical protein